MLTYHIFSHSFTSGSGGGNPLKTSKTGRLCEAAWVRSVRRSTEQYQPERRSGLSLRRAASGGAAAHRRTLQSPVRADTSSRNRGGRRTPPSTTPSSATSPRQRSSRRKTTRHESVARKIPHITNSSKERCTLSFSLLIMHASCTLIPTFATIYLKAG